MLQQFDPSKWVPGADAIDADALRSTLDEIAKRDAEEFRRQMEQRYSQLRAASAIPECFSAATPAQMGINPAADEPIRRAQDQARRIAIRSVSGWPAWRASGGWLVLIGNEGTGKTLLASVIANGLLSIGVSVRYVQAASASDQIRYSYGQDSKTSERALMDAWLSADLLILDELGAQTASAHDLKITWALVNGRYTARKPMIICSNFSLAKLEEALGPNIAGRIIERSADRMVLDMVWPSWRRK